MDISALLSTNLVLCRHHASSKKRILEDIAHHLSQHLPELDNDSTFSALIAREKLGSTGIGKGIAIPHCRLKGTQSVIAMLITLDEAIDFDAIDNAPVDVIFVLLVPDDDNDQHLQTLASIANAFSCEQRLEKIRQANDLPALLQAVT